VNGTSGYEEAACQGLMAGINAALKQSGQDPLILKRNEAYIGVLIDDLVTKGVNDPYRLLTSRAEYRLLLRHDNADIRLREYGRRVGLVDDNRYQAFQSKLKQIQDLKTTLHTIQLYPTENDNAKLDAIQTVPIKDKTSLYELLRRPEVTLNALTKWVDLGEYSDEVIEQTEIDIKYEGYIKKAEKQAEKMLKMEDYVIPQDLDYDTVHNLALEAREKLKRIRPITIGQASRISGVNPADISILLIHIKTLHNRL